ncbi:hypothetical protein, partial [uncultured Marinobacter sp.]|uniref:hypothetical protein n=1 Tax=uncultured Marinobacter sp. TaxID=187379 RepID=UPI00259A9339
MAGFTRPESVHPGGSLHGGQCDAAVRIAVIEEIMLAHTSGLGVFEWLAQNIENERFYQAKEGETIPQVARKAILRMKEFINTAFLKRSTQWIEGRIIGPFRKGEEQYFTMIKNKKLELSMPKGKLRLFASRAISDAAAQGRDISDAKTQGSVARGYEESVVGAEASMKADVDARRERQHIQMTVDMDNARREAARPDRSPERGNVFFLGPCEGRTPLPEATRASRGTVVVGPGPSPFFERIAASGIPQIAEIYEEDYKGKKSTWKIPFFRQEVAGALCLVSDYGGSMHGRWRNRLRQALIAMIRIVDPSDETRIAACTDVDFTDIRCVSELFMLQQRFGLTGLLPANIFWIAIQSYELEVDGELDPKPGETITPAAKKVKERRTQVRALVGRLTPPPGVDKAFGAGDQRAPLWGAILCDSGGHQWSGDTDNPKNHQSLGSFLKSPADNMKMRWSGMTISSGSGHKCFDFLEKIRDFKLHNHHRLVANAEGVMVYPHQVPMIVIDNLNVVFEEGSNKFCGMTPAAMSCYMEIVEELTTFTCAVYVCTAPAEHWGISPF